MGCFSATFFAAVAVLSERPSVSVTGVPVSRYHARFLLLLNAPNMTDSSTSNSTTIRKLLDRVEDIMLEAAQATRPLEVDPARTQLFALFVEAYQAGLVNDEVPSNLTADGLCSALSTRWGLKDTVQESVKSQSKLSGDQLAQMRSLWSVMRMWMEWTYAWDRWADHHPSAK